MMNWVDDITIISPTLNERLGVEELSQFFYAHYRRLKWIVVDDGSIDGTQDIIRECVHRGYNIELLDRSKENIHGLTISVLDGIRKCNSEYFIVMDADMQHPPEKIEEIANKLMQGNDLVVGVRIPNLREWPYHRYLMTFIFNSLAYFRLKNRHMIISDYLSGFFGMRTDLAKDIIKHHYKKFQGEGYKVLFDFLKFLPQDIKIDEVPYYFNSRKGGKSKITLKTGILFLKTILT